MLGRSRKTKRRRSRRPSSRPRWTSRRTLPSCPAWRGGNSIFNSWKMRWDANATGDQGLRDVTRRETCRKQLRQGGDVDRWQSRSRSTSCERWCGWIALRCDLEQVEKRQDRTDMFHRTESGCPDNRSRFRGLVTTRYRPTTLERGSRCTARGRRFLRGRRDDERTRRSDRHSGCFLHY